MTSKRNLDAYCLKQREQFIENMEKAKYHLKSWDNLDIIDYTVVCYHYNGKLFAWTDINVRNKKLSIDMLRFIRAVSDFKNLDSVKFLYGRFSTIRINYKVHKI